jgi:hypothetical protein
MIPFGSITRPYIVRINFLSNTASFYSSFRVNLHASHSKTTIGLMSVMLSRIFSLCKSSLDLSRSLVVKNALLPAANTISTNTTFSDYIF